MPRKSVGEYPPNWNEIAIRIKQDAGWHCVRCGHLSGANAVTPVEFDMAISAKGDQVGECISLTISFEAKITKRLNVGNRQFFRQFIPMLTAVLAGMSISVARLIALLSPVRAIVRIFSAFPVGAFIPAKVLGKPLKAAGISTKTLRGVRRRYGSFLSARLAHVSNSVRFAGARAILAVLGIGSLFEIGFSAPLANFLNFCGCGFIPARARAENLVWIASARDNFFLTDGA